MLTPNQLSPRDFQRLAKFIYDYSGIHLVEKKKEMLEGRLRKRMIATGAVSMTAYCQYLFDDGGLDTETVALIDVVTTNKTDFFREPDHFKFLAGTVLPRLAADRRTHNGMPVKLWCAASSIGAEPYTLAMVMADCSRQMGNFGISITATDISTRVLETAILGIYPEEMVEPVPLEMRKRYLLRSKDGARGLVRVVPELRRLVQFGRLNLMDRSYPVAHDLDIVFCRNILIYFDRKTQKAVLSRICKHLRPGGYLMLGYSETLTGYGLPVKPLGSNVFQRE